MKTTPRKRASPPNQANNFTPMNASQLNGVAGGGAGGNGGGSGGGMLAPGGTSFCSSGTCVGESLRGAATSGNGGIAVLSGAAASLAALRFSLERGDSLGQCLDRPAQLSQAIERQQEQNKTKK